MKYFLFLFLTLLFASVGAQPAPIDYIIVPSKTEKVVPPLIPFDVCVPFSMHMTIDKDVSDQIGLDKIEQLRQFFINGYASINMKATVTVEYLLEKTYFGTVHEDLRKFQLTPRKADVNLLYVIDAPQGGGVAYYDQLGGTVPFGVCNVNPSVTNWPNYSFSSLVPNHEAGHVLGALHTHSCAWGATEDHAIDNYVGTEGACELPQTTTIGTCMGYGHLRGLGGPLFNREVANRVRAKTYAVNGACEAIVDCTENEVSINITLDAYPSETSYLLTTFSGDTIISRGPFPRYAADGSNMAGQIVGDTICIPDGCFIFEIFDDNGLVSSVCVEGAYEITGPNGLQVLGADFTSSEITRFCLGVTPPDSDCQEVVLRADSLIDYANQSRFPFPLIQNEGINGVSVYGNNWRALAYEYTITPYTELTFDATNIGTGEIQGVSLVSSEFGIYPDRTFRFAGTQNWGIPIVPVAEGETKTLTIAVGRYFTGDITHFVLVNDDDVRGLVNTKWENVVLCENDGGEISKGLLFAPQGTAEDEAWNDTEWEVQEWIKARAKARRPYPNPVVDTLTLGLESMWHLCDVHGRVIDSGWGDKVDMSLLPPGFYILHDGATKHKIIKQ